METFIQILIIIHAGFGGIALISGLIAMTATKGMKVHRKAGKIFFYTMVISALTAMIVALLPNHQSPFLFAVGVFSMFFILMGYRALRFKFRNPSLVIDKTISIVMITTGVLMIFLPIILSNSINIILTVFGVMGIVFAIRFLLLFRDKEKLRANWLKMHLGNMMGGYISAFTAFMVVNQFLSSYFAWFGPGILGGFYIAYWLRKVDKTKTAK